MEFENEIINSTKLIAVGDEGINYIEIIKSRLEHNMSIESININSNLDKEYVMNLLDGVEILILIYNTKNKEILNIIKAISFMSNERRIMSIGLDLSDDKKDEELNLNREIFIGEENISKTINLVNMMIDSVSEKCMVGIDVTDLKEIICSDKGFLYTYDEFNKEATNSIIVESLLNNSIQIGDGLNTKKGIVLCEVNANNINEDMLIKINDISSMVSEKIEGCEFIYSINTSEKSDCELKILLAYN